MIKIALVKKNRCSFDRMDEFVPPLLYKQHSVEDSIKLKNALDDYIWSVLEQYVTFIDVDISDMMDVICEKITKDFPDKDYGDFFYMTEGSYSSPKNYLEFIYAQPKWTTYVKSQLENMNNIGCLFSLKHAIIENSCVVISNKYDLTKKKFVSVENITKYDLIKVIRKRYFHSAILIKENSVVKYYYQNPGVLASTVFGLDIEKDSIETLAFTLFKYNLNFNFMADKTKYINQIATRINAQTKIHGDVLVLNELEEHIYTNLSIYEFKRLNLLSYGKLSDRELVEAETFDIGEETSTEEKRDIIWSKYLVADHRYPLCKQNKKKCMCCGFKIKNQIDCPHCFRVKYCSIECCVRDFTSFHFGECIYD